MIITRTPFRVTLGGGGTDLPSYYSRFGGFIFSFAIDYMGNLQKLSAREALRVLSRFGLTVQLTGDGVVVDQNPPAGSLINRGMKSALQLARWPIVEPNSQ
mgnify:CR=1 FL=1